MLLPEKDKLWGGCTSVICCLGDQGSSVAFPHSHYESGQVWKCVRILAPRLHVVLCCAVGCPQSLQRAWAAPAGQGQHTHGWSALLPGTCSSGLSPLVTDVTRCLSSISPVNSCCVQPKIHTKEIVMTLVLLESCVTCKGWFEMLQQQPGGLGALLAVNKFVPAEQQMAS